MKSVVHIGVCLNYTPWPCNYVLKRIRDDVKDVVRFSYNTLDRGMCIDGHKDLFHGHRIKSIVCEDITSSEGGHAASLDDAKIKVVVYVLYNEPPSRSGRRITQSSTDEDVEKHLRIRHLPHTTLQHDWQSLIYDHDLQYELLNSLIRVQQLLDNPSLDMRVFNWNRVCLLYGPPGSGKSTLCRALAQKLSIRLIRLYPDTILVEINTNSMLSKYFGESGKLVDAFFKRIIALAQSSDTLVCVVMDEIETIAGTREKVSQGGDCDDGLRATNQLLTALDRIRDMPNIIILCTSNLINAIDSAFLDRVDIKQLVPSPSVDAVYEIFTSCLNELLRTYSIIPDSTSPTPSSYSSSYSSDISPTSTPSSSVPSWEPSPTASRTSFDIPTTTIPPRPKMPTLAQTTILDFADPETPGQKLLSLSRRAAEAQLSGRTLRRLVLLGLAKYTCDVSGGIRVREAVEALGKAVEVEICGAMERR